MQKYSRSSQSFPIASPVSKGVSDQTPIIKVHTGAEAQWLKDAKRHAMVKRNRRHPAPMRQDLYEPDPFGFED